MENNKTKYSILGGIIGAIICIVITIILFMSGLGTKIGICKATNNETKEEQKNTDKFDGTRIDDDKTCDVIATKVSDTNYLIEYKVSFNKECETTYVLLKNRTTAFYFADLTNKDSSSNYEYKATYGLNDKGTLSGLSSYKSYEDMLKDDYHFYYVSGHLILDNRTVNGLEGEYFIFNGLDFYGPDSDKNDVNVKVNASEIDENGTLFYITDIESNESKSIIFTSKIYTTSNTEEYEDSEKLNLVKRVESGDTFDIDDELAKLGLEDFPYERKITYKLVNQTNYNTTPEVEVTKTIKDLYNEINK